jgi:hypothetical protein
MKFSKEFLEDVLSKRESLNILSEGKITTIKTIKFMSDLDIESIDEVFETLDFDYPLEERVQIKRKYGEHSSYNVNKGASIRNPIIEFVGSRFVTEKELSNFLLKLEEDRGNTIDQKRWFSRNQKYFESFQNRGHQVWTLSKFGKRVFEFVIKQKNQKQINESSIGLFKMDLLNEGDMTKFYDGFVVLDYKTKNLYKFKYVRGTSNSKVEDAAISDLVKKIKQPSSNFTVHGFVKKGEWDKSSAEVLESNDSLTESINDPVLIALRAAKDQRKSDLLFQKQLMKNRVYGKKREALEDRLYEIYQELKELSQEKSQLYREMDAEAGEKGDKWSDADGNRYGNQLNVIDDQISVLIAKRIEIETKLAF